MLEESLHDRWVEGEVTGLSTPASGHVYFSLRDLDDGSLLPVTLFRSDALRSRTKVTEGLVLRVKGNAQIWAPKGQFRLLAQLVVGAGEGDSRAELERIKKKLAAEGLLAPERKRKLPPYPSTIGVVTSAQGAALHDIVHVAWSRFPARIVVSPCIVQGPNAPASILRALDLIQKVDEVEVVIIGRGGGSAEDLAAFNNERVARAVGRCRVPVVSAVGHETDVSIVDLVADERAATPSHAAERVLPIAREMRERLETERRHLDAAIESRMGRARLALERCEKKLAGPAHRIERQRSALAGMSSRLEKVLRVRIAKGWEELARSEQRLRLVDPRLRVTTARDRHVALVTRLVAQRARSIIEARERLARVVARLEKQRGRAHEHAHKRYALLVAKLESLSPLGVLARGYALVRDVDRDRVLVDAADARVESPISIRLARGTVRARVEGTES